MTEQFVIVFKQAFTLFIMLGVGFFIGKKKYINDEGMKGLTFLMLNVALPCSIIKSFMMETQDGFLQSIAYTFLVVIAMSVVFMVFSLLLFRREDSSRKAVMQVGSIYSNSAYMGIALVQVVLGAEAVIYTTILFIVELIFLLIQIEVTMSKGKPSLKKVLKNPGVIGFVIGLLLLIFGLKLPSMVSSAVTSLGTMNSPLAMIILGLQMAKANLKTVFNQKVLYWSAFVKLVAAPVIAAVVLIPFKLPAIAFCSIVISKATCQPTVLSAFAAQKGKDAVIASQLIALTSMLQLIILPLVAATATQLFFY